MIKKSFLNRIISIDSLAKGKMTELKVHHHANLSGGNGAGKTTWLRTLPFFYGASPSYVSPVDNNNFKFVNHYLPKPTSLIIFEYQNQRGMNCVVTYRHSSGEKPAYRFLAEPFDELFFTEIKDGEKLFLPAKDLSSHWMSLGLRYSNQIESVTDYKAIIMGDKDLIRKSSIAHELSTLTAVYGLSNRTGQLKHMDKIALATLNRTADFNAFSSMLGSIMVDDGTTVPNAINFGEIYEMINSVSVIQELDKNLSFFRGVVQKGLAYFENEKQLDLISSELTTLKFNLNEKVSVIEGKITEINDCVQKETLDWNNREFLLQSECAKTKSEFDAADKKIEILTAQNDEWLDKKIDLKKAELENLPMVIERLGLAKLRLDALENVVRDIKSEFDKLAADETNRHHQTMLSLSDKIAEIKDELKKQEEYFQEEKGNIEKAKNAEISLENEHCQAQLAELSHLIGETRQLATNTIFTEAELANLKMAEGELENARFNLKSAYEARNQGDANLKSLKLLANIKHDEWRAEVKDVNAIESDIVSLTALFQPKPGTLLYELKNKDDFNMDAISKVIRPELLDRKDLFPQHISDTNKDSIMGWIFDLTKVAKPAWALSLDEQKVELSKLDNALAVSTQHANDLERSYKKAQRDVVAEEDRISKISQNIKSCENRVASLLSAVTSEKEKNESNAYARKQDAKKRLDQLFVQEVALKERKRSAISSISDRYHEDFNELFSTHSIEKSRLQSLIDHHERQKSDEKASSKRVLDQIQRDYLAKCSDKNVDDKQISQCKAEVKSFESEIQKIKSYQAEIEKYNIWLKNEWEMRDAYQSDLSQCRKAKDIAYATLSNEKDLYVKSRNEKLNLRNELIREQTSCKADLQECVSVLVKIGATTNSNLVQNPRSVEVVLSEARNLSEYRESLRNEINEGVETAHRAICSGGPDNQIASVWASYVRDQKDISSPENININLTQSLEKLTGEVLDQQRHAVTDFIHNTGAQIAKFYDELVNISESISSHSKSMSRIISEKNFFPDIKDVRIVLTSKVNSQEYWPALNTFQKMWSDWKSQNKDGLPPKPVIDQLLVTYKILQKYQPDSKIESLFDLQVKALENGREVDAKNSAQFSRLSSTGLSSLILYTLLGGLTSLLNKDKNVMINWPVDELMTISPENTVRLFNMLDDKGIIMLGGFPSSDVNALRNFKEHHEVKRNGTITKIIVPEDKLAALISERNKLKSENGVAV